MANSNSGHSKKLRAATAAAATKAKLASGEYRQFSVQGRAEDVELILAAVEKAGAAAYRLWQRFAGGISRGCLKGGKTRLFGNIGQDKGGCLSKPMILIKPSQRV
ncbi:hypothetical protein [Neisseria gonorrhoeae]|uniref:hypothetical protein n=1 Tax=Neisseria gonorrhoeae TaxID=485 RepID=UPI0010C59C9F|nr:hypothetical protein [Neisseria gonorrhoeae]QBK51527.1 phage associated protein [Neisseria gonorrhoeae]